MTDIEAAREGRDFSAAIHAARVFLRATCPHWDLRIERKGNSVGHHEPVALACSECGVRWTVAREVRS